MGLIRTAFSLILVLLMASRVAHPSEAQDAHGGQHAFDFELGSWHTRLSLLRNPLSGSSTWVEYEGTSEVRSIWDGRANLVELDVSGPSGHIQGLNLRLYNPELDQWSLHFANARTGTMTEPVVGRFSDGRGAFYGQEMIDGRVVFVRFFITEITPDSVRFEQAFSGDGGATWETNWVAIDTRVKDDSTRSRAVQGRDCSLFRPRWGRDR